MAKEQAKHLERQAKLDRMKKLAQEKGHDKQAAKVDELMARETARHERKMQKLADKTQNIEQRSEKGAGELEKAKGKKKVKGPDKSRPKTDDDDDEDKESD
jgi:hypothetical protein